jgi:fructose-1,6-bisphosphatase II / sedoheptulose-1,7-bisphosphatase
MSKSEHSNGTHGPGLERILVLELARVTEAAAIAAAQLRGRGNEKAADKAAVDAMRKELGRVEIRGTVVIGEGEMDEAPMLYIGEKVGTGEGPEVDIAVDPLEGTTICAKSMPNALAVLAIAERGGFLHAPDMYMNKIAVGPGYPDDIVDLDATPADNLKALAKAKGVPINEIMACILDRPRHAELIHAVRETGGLMPMKDEERIRAEKMGISDIRKKFRLEDMASADVVFSATGVTDGSLLKGVRIRGDFAETETVVMRSKTGTVRRIKSTVRNVGSRFI